MQGASALQDTLTDLQGSPLLVLIVWEPVLWSDLGPPASSVLSIVSDKRAVQFWDEDRSLSRFMVQSATEDLSILAPGDSVTPDTIVWDFVAVFPPGASWSAHPRPSYYGGPVVDVIDQVRSRLSGSTPPAARSLRP